MADSAHFVSLHTLAQYRQNVTIWPKVQMSALTQYLKAYGCFSIQLSYYLYKTFNVSQRTQYIL